MVVYLKHVGVTDSVRDRLKTSVKTLASWSAHAQSTRSCDPSGPAALWLRPLNRSTFTSTMESMIIQSFGTADALMYATVLLASKQAWKLFSLSGRLVSLGSSWLCFPFVLRNSLQALPHPMSVGAGVVQFNLSPVLTLCLFDGSSEGIAGFLICPG
jgi:hypothetical protein